MTPEPGPSPDLHTALRRHAKRIAQAAHAQGAELCLSYRGERERERAEELSSQLGGVWALPCDVAKDEDIAGFYEALQKEGVLLQYGERDLEQDLKALRGG